MAPQTASVAKLDGDKRMVLLLDPAHLLEGGEVQAIEQFGEPGAPVDEPPALPLAA